MTRQSLSHHRRGLARVLAISTIALVATGCGAQSSPSTTAIAVDCSKSVRGARTAWYKRMSSIASEVLSANDTLMVGCFAGTRSGVSWLPAYEGASVGPMTGADARRERQARWGESLQGVFERRLRVMDVNGTDWLSALESAARLPKVHKIYIFSDLVQEAEGINLTRPETQAQLSEMARTWRSRLSALRGKLVISVGGGQRNSDPENDHDGVVLLEDLARLVPFQDEIQSD